MATDHLLETAFVFGRTEIAGTLAGNIVGTGGPAPAAKPAIVTMSMQTLRIAYMATPALKAVSPQDGGA